MLTFTRSSCSPLCVALVAASFALEVVAQPVIQPGPWLIASDATRDLNFGDVVAVSGDRVIVGKNPDGDLGFEPGYAYVFDAATGEELRILRPSEDYYNNGRQVDIDGPYAALVSPTRRIFVFDVETGQELYILRSATVDGFYRYLANSIEMDAGRIATTSIAADAPDIIRIRLYDTATGDLIRDLVPMLDPDRTRFSTGVAIGGNTVAAVINGIRWDDNVPSALFIFDATTGQQRHRIELPPVGDVNWLIGSMHPTTNGEVVVVGDPNCCDRDDREGRVLVYDAHTGELIRTIEPECPNWHIGMQVRLVGDVLFVAARRERPDATCTVSGGNYHFMYDVRTGEIIGLLDGDGYRSSADFDGRRAAEGNIGHGWHDDLGGGMRVFEIPNLLCPADTNNDGLVTPADFSAWILAYNNQAPACDQNGDGLCTPADFSSWIMNFNSGC